MTGHARSDRSLPPHGKRWRAATAELRRSTALRLILQSALCAGVAVSSSVVRANPTGGTVVAGTATINQANPNQTVINQSSDKAIINWSSFSIDANQATIFHQPSSSATALNRVTGGDPSVIAGRLQANGNIILVNPSGI